MTKIIQYIFIYLITFDLCSQSPNIEWQKSLGGTGIDKAYSIIQTLDGGYIAVGETNSNDGDVSGNHGQKDLWLIKLNEFGVLDWQKCYGGNGLVVPYTGDDVGYSIFQTSEGGFIIAGSTSSNNFDVSGFQGGIDFWVLKIDISGNIQWQKCFGGTAVEFAKSIQQTNEGDYIVTGWAQGDFWILKLDTDGNIIWQKTIGGTGSDTPECIKQTIDGGYIVVGKHNSEDLGVIPQSFGGALYDTWVVKLNSLGDLEWQKSIGDIGEDQMFSVQQLSNGNYILCGFSNSPILDYKGVDDLWIVNLSNQGEIIWQKRFGGESQDRGLSVNTTQDGGIILAGTTASTSIDVSGNHGLYDFWVLRIDLFGNIVWQKCFGGSNHEIAFSINQTNDGGFIVSGYTDSNDGDVTNNNGQSDFWIIKLSSENSLEYFDFKNSIDYYPNPTSNSITIKGEKNMNQSFSIFDQLGREVLKGKLNGITTEVHLSTLSKGIYTLKIEGNYKPAQIVKE